MASMTNITEAIDSLKSLISALPTAVSIDETLTISGYAADAKAVGDALEVPYIDFVTIGMDDYETSPQYFHIAAEQAEMIKEIAQNPVVKLVLPWSTTTVERYAFPFFESSYEISFIFNTYDYNSYAYLQLLWSEATDGGIEYYISYSTYSNASIGHTHLPSEIVSGTFSGEVIASSSHQEPDTFLLRNSKLVTAEINPSNNGEICWQYE